MAYDDNVGWDEEARTDLMVWMGLEALRALIQRLPPEKRRAAFEEGVRAANAAVPSGALLCEELAREHLKDLLEE